MNAVRHGPASRLPPPQDAEVFLPSRRPMAAAPRRGPSDSLCVHIQSLTAAPVLIFLIIDPPCPPGVPR
ncbi:hypothetical protein EYF80_067238 [Liparis tanakae]|uniref:Uncharacterized protein n=1 Tax=Liparis tanakae TaxID=230148 RepID=A0A4Z2E1M4_9TELE|nr:hypothetical protein EYF80_067238 [Liparis tanakae]